MSCSNRHYPNRTIIKLGTSMVYPCTAHKNDSKYKHDSIVYITHRHWRLAILWVPVLVPDSKLSYQLLPVHQFTIATVP